MDDAGLVHQPGHHPLLPLPKTLHVRAGGANAKAAEILKQMMADAPIAEDQVLDISAGVESSPKEETVCLPTPKPPTPEESATPPGSSSEGPSESFVENTSEEDHPRPTEVPLTTEDALPTPTSSPKHIVAPTEHAEPEQRLENGCDLPMPKSDDGHVPKVDLNPGLSSLSPQHPTRVWNCLLHSCPPDNQPLVEWEFSTHPHGHSAQMTLVLPPAHPIMKTLAKGMALPWDSKSAEYADVARQLGGVRRWSGKAKQLKADAQNDAIRKCIADNGLLWANYDIMRNVDPKAYLGDRAATSRGGRPMLTDPVQVQPYGHALKRAVEDDHTSRIVKPKLTETMASATKLTSVGIQDTPRTGAAQCTSHVVERLQVPATDTRVSQVFKGRLGQVDWQEQLAAFCTEAGLPAPKYYQRIERQPGSPTQFFGQVTVEHDHFESDKGFIKLKDARQEVARFVFCEHFGQEPSAD